MNNTVTFKYLQHTQMNKFDQNTVPKSKPHEIWSEKEQFIIFEEFKKKLLKWKHIAKHLTNRTENSVKSFFYATIRKIKKLKFLKMIKMMICFPTFRNNSKFSLK
jgi:hypothetical protein